MQVFKGPLETPVPRLLVLGAHPAHHAGLQSGQIIGRWLTARRVLSERLADVIESCRLCSAHDAVAQMQADRQLLLHRQLPIVEVRQQPTYPCTTQWLHIFLSCARSV